MLGKYKGQLFLILSLLFLIYFAFLFASFSPYPTLLKSRESLEYYLYAEEFENIKNEQKNIFEYFYFNSSLLDYLKNFTLYAREKFDGRGEELRSLILLASYEQIKANQQQNLVVALLNLERDGISNIKITFTYDNTSAYLPYLSDGEEFQTSFAFNVSSDSDYQLILRYWDGEDQKYAINVPIRIGKSKKIAFFVDSLKAKNFLIKEDFSQVK